MPVIYTSNTFSDIVSAMDSYYQRSVTWESPGMATAVNTALSRIARALSTQEMDTLLSLTTADLPYTLPADYIEVKAVICTRGSYSNTLVRGNLSTVRGKQQTANNGTIPYEYCIVGNTLDIGPNPATDDTFEVLYTAQVAYLYTGTDTNMISKKYFDVLVAGGLSEAYKMIHDDERSTYWENLFQSRLAEAITYAEKEQWSGTPLVIRSA